MIILVIVLIIVGILILLFNQIVREENATKNAFSTVDVYLKKRYDLIPNLVETVKGYAAHEMEIFQTITQIRSKAMEAQKSDDVVKADNQLNGALKSLFAVAEKYPNLKSNTLFLELQKKLLLLEDELAAARRTYNAAVTEYNTTLESFPTNVFGKILNKKKKELFTATDEVRSAISINI